MSHEDLYESTIKLTLQEIEDISHALKIENKNRIKAGVESILYIHSQKIEQLEQFHEPKIIELKKEMINTNFLYEQEESINVYVVGKKYTFEFYYYKKIE
jgi:NCAIR mutase (PurE)-related protein